MNKNLNLLIELYKKNDFLGIYEFYKKNLKIQKYDFLSLKIIGNTLYKLSKFDDAILILEKSKELKDNDYEVNLTLAASFNSLGKYKESLLHIKNCLELNNNNAIAYNLAGTIFANLKNFVQAEENFKKTLEIEPNFLEALYNLALIFFNRENYNLSEIYFSKIEKLNEDYKDINFYLAITKRKLNKFEDSLNRFRKIIKSGFKIEVCSFNLGKIYSNLNNFKEAIKYFNKSIEVNPQYEPSYNAKAILFSDYNDYLNAELIYLEAKKIFPNSKYVLYNLALLYANQKKYNQAIKYINKSIQIDENFAEANYALSHIYLIQGNYKKGWEKFKWRHITNKDKVNKYLKDFYLKSFNSINDSKKLKSINNISGKTILVIHEQGLGDIIQFSRYLKLLVKNKSRVIFWCKKNLQTLLFSIDKNINIISEYDPSIKFDNFCILMDLPKLFDTTISNIPSYLSYVSIPEDEKSKRKNLLDKKKFKIGIAWQGSKTKIDKGRSFNLEMFSEISQQKNVQLVSLQKNYGSEQIIKFKKNYKITFFSNLDPKNDFIDTASIITNLDLVISPCTSIAHLAGSLGAKVWLLLKFYPDWRWLDNGVTTKWYPSMKIYRQEIMNEWGKVFDNVLTDLKKIL